MASEEKIQKMLDLMDSKKTQRDLLQGIIDRMLMDVVKRGDDIDSVFQKIRENTQEIVLGHANEFLVQYFKEHLSDEEVDEMICFFSSPVFKRLKEITHAANQDMVIHTFNSTEKIKEELRNMYKEVVGKVAKKNK